jgi:hypothetical protein
MGLEDRKVVLSATVTPAVFNYVRETARELNTSTSRLVTKILADHMKAEARENQSAS